MPQPNDKVMVMILKSGRMIELSMETFSLKDWQEAMRKPGTLICANDISIWVDEVVVICPFSAVVKVSDASA